LGSLTLNSERQSARISKITSDGLTRSGTGCFIATIMYLYGNSGRHRVNQFNELLSWVWVWYGYGDCDESPWVLWVICVDFSLGVTFAE